MLTPKLRSDDTPAAFLAALANPTRLAFLAALAAGPKTVTDVAAGCGVVPATATKHLRVLRDAGLVAFEKDYGFNRYRLTRGDVTGGRLELTHPSGMKVIIPVEE